MAEETREGDVYRRLLEKLEEARQALGGQVFDVLGKLQFEGKPLRELMIEAIRYGDRPDVRARLALIVREERVLASIPEPLAPFRVCLEELNRSLPIDRAFLSPKALEDLPGKEILSRLNAVFERLEADLTAIVASLQPALQRADEGIGAVRRDWSSRKEQVQAAYEKITEGIVPRTREEKQRRQFLFSTHNANIPVLGDAELIIGLAASGEANGGHARMAPEHMGSIDDRPVRELVEEILEGGREAFERRRRKYGF